MSATHRNIASYLKKFIGDVIKNIVAAGAGDATESDGDWVDRSTYQSAELCIAFECVIGLAETLTISGNIQDADDNAGLNAADFGDAIAAEIVATGAGSPSNTVTGVKRVGFNLHGAKLFVRSQITPDLSAGATDTAEIMVVWILGGAEEVPTV